MCLFHPIHLEILFSLDNNNNAQFILMLEAQGQNEAERIFPTSILLEAVHHS